MVLSTCSHYEQYIQNNGFEVYNLIFENFIRLWRGQRRVKSQCFDCDYTGTHLHGCLHCVYFACHPKHMTVHAKKENHQLGVQIKFGFVRCFKCDHYVYHDDILEKVQKNLMPSYSLIALKRRFDRLTSVLKDSQKYPERKYAHSLGHYGLRGLLNLGNTCFMNCIIQTLMHTPVFRDYFFSSKHEVCNYQFGPSKCLQCEVHTLYQEFYSGETLTLPLHRLLALIWNNAEHLAGYEQQDAHDFYMTILDILHKHCTRTLSPEGKIITPNDQDCSKCPCIVHKVFSGYFQSDVVCQSCWSVSTTVEEFMEIGVNIDTYPSTQTLNTDSQVQMMSLIDGLENYIRAEHLGSSTKVECRNCKTHQESTKQLTINRLPVVICIHLKRFEQSNKNHKKISTPVQFPEELDMGPFTTEYRNASLSAANSQFPVNLVPSTGVEFSKYKLFSVVNHHGSIDAGHYTSYIRLSDDTWYKCNDEIISKADLLDVLCSEGYLLFYHKLVVDYSEV